MTRVLVGYKGRTIPAATFALVIGAHYLWLGLFPELDPAQAGWLTLPEGRSWLQTYLASGEYWLGYSYALSAAFAAAALLRYQRCGTDKARHFALGGITMSGILATMGCFLVGCCGSPMLVVWLNLFGAAFLPFAKPALAGITTLSIIAAWWWMARSTPCRNPQPAEKILSRQ